MILILCAGDSKRWTWGGASKFHIPVPKEALLRRTVRQCNDLWGFSEEVVVVSHLPGIDSALVGVDYSLFDPPERAYTCQTLESTRSLWKERTIVLLGDVYYTDKTIRRIYKNWFKFSFYGNVAQREIFSFSFTDRNLVSKALRKVSVRVLTGHHGQLWQLFYVLNGIRADEHPPCITFRSFFPVVDITQDFDTVADYLEFLERATYSGSASSSSFM